MTRGYVELPDGWQRVHAEGPWPFVTSEVFRDPDGHEVPWESRPHRKGPSVWWQPHTRNWWMALLFSIGSLCFAAGGLLSQFTTVSASTVSVIFFAGSIFFTAAAYLQYSEVVNSDRDAIHHKLRRRWRPASWEPGRIDWLSTLIQLIGTVLFNISTGAAMEQHLSAAQTDLRVWAPDIFGSVAFLLSSELAYAEVCHRWVCLRARGRSFRVVAVNLAGSGAFGASAIASLAEPGSGHLVSARISDAGTWVGALCFLAGAILLVPESAAQESAAAVSTS